MLFQGKENVPLAGLMLAILLSVCFLFIGCTTTAKSLADKKNYTEDNPEYRRKFEFTLDSSEKIIRYGYYYVVSSLASGYKVRVYHPDLKTLTEEKNYSTEALTLLHGEFKSWWDDGSIREQGFYQFGRKHGIWLEKEPGQGKSASGEYFNHRKEGIWTQLDTNGMIESVYTWLDGKRHGKFFLYDVMGEKVNEGLYRNDTLLSELFRQPLFTKAFIMKCEDDPNLDKYACTDAHLTNFMYTEIKYPPEAKQNKIQGTAIAQWVVERDGSIQNIRIPQSLSSAIRDQILKVIDRMPGWKPATRDGSPVQSTITVPIEFKL